jgi:hypothetical protein
MNITPVKKVVGASPFAHFAAAGMFIPSKRSALYFSPASSPGRAPMKIAACTANGFPIPVGAQGDRGKKNFYFQPILFSRFIFEFYKLEFVWKLPSGPPQEDILEIGIYFTFRQNGQLPIIEKAPVKR